MKWREIRARRHVSNSILDKWLAGDLNAIEAGKRLRALDYALGIERPKPKPQASKPYPGKSST